MERLDADGLRSIHLADAELARLCEIGRLQAPVGYDADEIADLARAERDDDRLAALGLLADLGMPSLTLEARTLLDAVTASATTASIEVEADGRLRFLDLALSEEAAVFVERGGDDARLTAVAPDAVLAALVRITGITSRPPFMVPAFSLAGEVLTIASVRARSFGAAAAAAVLREAAVDAATAACFGAALAAMTSAARVAVEGVAAVAWFDSGAHGLWLTHDVSDATEVRVVVEPTSAPELVRLVGNVLLV